jgi:hypothetical protein
MSNLRIMGLANDFDNVLFAAECLMEVHNKHEIRDVADQVLENLKTLTSNPETYYSSRYKQIGVTAIKLTSNLWSDNPKILLWLQDFVLTSTSKDFQFAALEQIGTKWKNDEVCSWLHCHLTHDNPFVRAIVVEVLGQFWRDEEWMCDFLYNHSTGL